MLRLPRRDTARILMLDTTHRLFLIRYQSPHQDCPDFWYTPGGGLDAGETHEQAAIREIAEETGIQNAVIGSCIAHRNWENRLFTRPTFTCERYFPLWVKAPNQIDTSLLVSTEEDVVLETRWWTISELQQTQEKIVPEQLVSLVQHFLHGTIPAGGMVLT